VILPGRAFTEKDGTVTNMEGRVQRIRKGIDAEWVWEDWRVLQQIANGLGASWSYDGVSAITAALASGLAPYAAAINVSGRVLWGDAT